METAEYNQLSLEMILNSCKSCDKNITKNKYHDPYCHDKFNSKCVMCKSIQKYIDYKDFSYKNKNLNYSLSESNYIYTESNNSIFVDNNTLLLITNQYYEKILSNLKIETNTLIGKTCSDKFKLYTLKRQDLLNYDQISQNDEFRRKKDNVILLKPTTVQNIILNLIQLFKICIDNQILVGFSSDISNIEFLPTKTNITIRNKSIDSRFRIIFNLPEYSSIKIQNNFVGAYLPYERSELMSTHQEIYKDDTGILSVQKKDKFISLHKTGLIDFNIGNCYSFLFIILQYCCHDNFSLILLSDKLLLKIWSYFWKESELKIIETQIAKWMDNKPSLLDIKYYLLGLSVKKNCINNLIENIQEIFKDV